MQVYPDKFQANNNDREFHNKKLRFMLQENQIDCEYEVKLLDATSDFQLTFHFVFHKCIKASQQLNALKMIIICFQVKINGKVM